MVAEKVCFTLHRYSWTVGKMSSQDMVTINYKEVRGCDVNLNFV